MAGSDIIALAEEEWIAKLGVEETARLLLAARKRCSTDWKASFCQIRAFLVAKAQVLLLLIRTWVAVVEVVLWEELRATKRGIHCCEVLRWGLLFQFLLQLHHGLCECTPC